MDERHGPPAERHAACRDRRQRRMEHGQRVHGEARRAGDAVLFDDELPVRRRPARRRRRAERELRPTEAPDARRHAGDGCTLTRHALGHAIQRSISMLSRLNLLGAALMCAAIPFAARGQNAAPAATKAHPPIVSRSAPVLEVSGLRFRDLNRNGQLDPYEDWRLTPAARARDLVSKMTLEEKAGAMMHGTARSSGQMGGAGVGTGYDTAANRALIDGAKVNSMITRLGGDPATLAAQDNARQEYRAVGIQMALSPQADLSTEPRWARTPGTFGEDAALAGRMVRAYVEGFQHGANGVDTGSVLTIVKHWVGYGAAKQGLDGHNYYGRFADFTRGGNDLEYHVRPFVGAFQANVAGVMPTYDILEGATWKGKPIEPVGAGFNKQLLTDILRGQYGFRGIILTDWAVTNDCNEKCIKGAPQGERPSFADIGMPWGVESLPKSARFVKAVKAGVDQFGGTEDARVLVEAVRGGELPEARLDEAVRRIMIQKLA